VPLRGRHEVDEVVKRFVTTQLSGFSQLNNG